MRCGRLGRILLVTTVYVINIEPLGRKCDDMIQSRAGAAGVDLQHNYGYFGWGFPELGAHVA